MYNSILAVLAALALTTPLLEDVRIEARLERREHSMDSNSTVEKFKVSGPTLRYEYNYSGYHPDPKFERELTYRAWVDQGKIEKLLKDKGLLKNLSREFPAPKGEPDRREILLELVIKQDGKTYTVRFHGAPGDALDADADYANALLFLNQLRTIAGEAAKE